MKVTVLISKRKYLNLDVDLYSHHYNQDIE